MRPPRQTRDRARGVRTRGRGERALVGAVHRVLREADADGALCRDRAGDALRLLQPASFATTRDTRPAASASRAVRKRAAQDHVHRNRLACHAGPSLRPARSRDDPEVRLRLSQLSRLGGDHDVARQRELATAAQAVARDRCEERRPQVADHLPILHPSLVDKVDRGRPRSAHSMSARAPAANARSEPPTTIARIASSAPLLQCAGELVHQLGREVRSTASAG